MNKDNGQLITGLIIIAAVFLLGVCVGVWI